MTFQITYKKRFYKPLDLCHCGAPYFLHQLHKTRCPKDVVNGSETGLDKEYYDTKFRWNGTIKPNRD